VRSPFCEDHTYFGPFWPLEADRAESVLSQGLDPWTQSLLSSVFTQVRGIGLLGSSSLEKMLILSLSPYVFISGQWVGLTY
jgi:hypothetical protein